MDTVHARQLIELNSAFYRRNADSFARTRRGAWPGWVRCFESMVGFPGISSEPCRVLDMACGTLRFESFLKKAFPAQAFEFYGVDNCALLQDDAASCDASMPGELRFQPLDVLGALAESWDARGGQANDVADDLARALAAPACNLSATFGFMHHVPTFAWRAVVLRALLAKTVSRGYACVSFWQFMRDEGLSRKARETTAEAKRTLNLPPDVLEEGDYLLGWAEEMQTYRYCHHFSDEEVDALLATVRDAADVVARFRADGRAGGLNSYVVLQRRC